MKIPQRVTDIGVGAWGYAVFCLLISFLLPVSSPAQTRFMKTFSTAANLVLANPNDVHQFASLAGVGAEGDGQGGRWKWYPGDSSLTNTTTIFASLFPGATGRWKKISEGTTVPDTGGFITNYTVITVPTIADLKNVSVTNAIQLVKVRDYATDGDGGGGDFQYFLTSTQIEDSGINIAPNNGLGMWERVVDPLGGVRVPWWSGIVTNGTIDAAINYASTHTTAPTVIVPGGTHQIDAVVGFTMKSNVRLVGDAGATLAVAANPSTNYQVVRFDAGATNMVIANLDFQGQPNAPGDAANFGRAFTVSGVTNLTWFGCSFTGFWSEAVKMGTNDWARPYPADRLGRVNSVLAFGADDSGATDSTAAFDNAIKALGSDVGGPVIVPPGKFAINLLVTNQNVWLDGRSSVITSPKLNNLVPWNTNLPVVQIGGDFPSPSLASHAAYNKLHGINFDGNGPNGKGKIGLLLTGGALKGEYHSGTSYDFAEHGVKIGGGTNQETLYNKFYNWHFENCDSGSSSLYVGRTNQAAWYNAAFPTSINDLSFFGCNWQGATAVSNSACLILDSAPMDVFGGWFQGRSHAGIILRKSTTSYPVVFAERARLEILEFAPDTGGSVAIWNQFDTNNLVGSSLRGPISVNVGTYYMSMEGVRIVVPTGGTLEDSTLLIQPLIWDNIFFQRNTTGGASGWTNLQTDIRVGRGGNDLNFNNTLGDYVFLTYTDGRGVVSYSTNTSKFTARHYDPIAGKVHDTRLAQVRTNYFEIQPAANSLLYLRGGSGNASFAIATNSKANLIHLGPTGVGVNRTASGASLEVDGQAALMLEASISTSRTYTNSAATTAGPWEVNQFIAPVWTNSSTVFHALYARQQVVAAGTNDLLALTSPIRASFTHGGPSNVVQAAGIQIDDVTVSGGGTISQFFGLRSSVTAGTGRYTINSSTAKSRHNGDFGVATEPLVAMHIAGGFAVEAVGADTALTVDDTVVTVGNRSYVRVAPDSSVATDRTVTISNGLATGQRLLIQNSGAGTFSFELVDTGNVNLASTWTGDNDDIIELFWDGSQWIETGRSAN